MKFRRIVVLLLLTGFCGALPFGFWEKKRSKPQTLVVLRKAYLKNYVNLSARIRKYYGFHTIIRLAFPSPTKKIYWGKHDHLLKQLTMSPMSLVLNKTAWYRCVECSTFFSSRQNKNSKATTKERGGESGLCVCVTYRLVHVQLIIIWFTYEMKDLCSDREVRLKFLLEAGKALQSKCTSVATYLK